MGADAIWFEMCISFIRALQQLLFPLRDFCDSYVDDIATFTSGRTEDRLDSWPLHLEQVRAFLLTMRKAGLTLKLEKCKFAQSSNICGTHNWFRSSWSRSTQGSVCAGHETTKF